MDKKVCKVCKKKIGITNSFECKCSKDYVFCALHRYPEEHECPIDHKMLERLALEKHLEKVVNKKLTSF